MQLGSLNMFHYLHLTNQKGEELENYIKNDKLAEGYYKIKHNSGLTMLLYPKENYTSSFVMLSVKFGAIDTSFEAEGKAYKIPLGTAHFLEHKALCSDDDDAFAVMSSYGADANAFTSAEKTAFYFSSINNIEECLEIMLKKIKECNHSKESIDREREIISQEIKMSEDECDWICYQNLLKAMYHDSVISSEIAGTAKSIEKINLQTLKECYKYFYNPSNMILAAAGNIDCEKIKAVVDRVFDKTCDLPVKKIYAKEPNEVKYHYIEINQPVSTPIFNLGFKIKEKEQANIRNIILDEMLIEIIAGDTTYFYKDMYDRGIINSTFCADTFNCRGLSAIVFEGESRFPAKVMDLMCKRIRHLQENGIDKENFIGYVKAAYGKYIGVFSSAEAIVNALLYFERIGGCLYDVPNILSSITVKEAEERLRNVISTEDVVLSVINTKQEEK